MKGCFLFLILLLSTFYSYGQEMLGAVSGNYAGLTGLQMNPSSMHNSKIYLDINLIGADAMVQNNYLYQSRKDYHVSNFFSSAYEWPTHQEEYGTDVRMFYHYRNHRTKDAYENLRVNGPGVMLVHGNHAFALTTAVRSVFSAHNIPYEIANFTYLGLNYIPQQNINYKDNRPFSTSELTWAEIGLSYSYVFYARGFNSIAAGISVRRLMGYAGGYMKVNSIDYIVPNDCTLVVKNLDAQYGFSAPMDYDKNEMWNDKTIKGGGFGFDIGITYTRKSHIHQTQYFNRLCAQQNEDYLYRIGLALIDVGAIRFNTHASGYSIDNKSASWTNLTKFNYQTINQLMDTISWKFYGDNKSSYRSDKVMVWLPSALTAQFDYHVYKNWYANASLVYGFALAAGSLHRPSELTVIPRYESNKFEIDLPVSLYDWTLPRVGIAMRLYWLTIGTDKLGGFFNFSDFTGMDVYFTVKIGFDKGICKFKGKQGCAEKYYIHKALR